MSRRYELMDTDLHQIIRSNQPLSDEHVQYFLYQARTCCSAAVAPTKSPAMFPHQSLRSAPQGTLSATSNSRMPLGAGLTV